MKTAKIYLARAIVPGEVVKQQAIFFTVKDRVVVALLAEVHLKYVIQVSNLIIKH